MDGLEPVYEAEVTEPPVAEPDVRRPRPMCGEMIVVTAARCRFCGEIFDPALKRARRPGPRGR